MPAVVLILVLLCGGTASGDEATSAARQKAVDADDNVPRPPGHPLGGAISFYQRYLSSLRHASCRFDPSCSEYARRAIVEHGLLVGAARAADRLMRCNGSASRYHHRSPDDHLADPATGPVPARNPPRTPPWLLPRLAMDPPILTVRDSSGGQLPRLAETLSFARHLSASGDCDRAGTEYQRAAHLADRPGWLAWARLHTGVCLFEASRWPEAEMEFLQAGLCADDSSGRDVAAYLAAACHFNAERYGTSGRLLADLRQQASLDASIAILAPTLAGLCDMSSGNWAGARAAFEEATNGRADEIWYARQRLLDAGARAGPDLPRRRKGLASVMSALIPGSGQMYAGRAKDGLRHLLFNGALAYTLVKLIQDDHYPAAYLVGTIAVPFYLGNIRGARYSVEEFNRRHRLEHLRDTLERVGAVSDG